MSSILGKYGKCLIPCPRCSCREWLIESWEGWKRTHFFANCRKCRFGVSENNPRSLIVKMKMVADHGRRGDSVPRSWRNLYATRPMRSAERRYAGKLMEDPEALPVDCRLDRRDKRFVYKYF